MRQQRLSGNTAHGHTRFPLHLLRRRPPGRGTDRLAYQSPGWFPSRRQTGYMPATVTRGRNPLHHDTLRRTASPAVSPPTGTPPAILANPSAIHLLSPDAHAARQTPPASTGYRPPEQQNDGMPPSVHHRGQKNLSPPCAAPSSSTRSRWSNQPTQHPAHVAEFAE